MKIWEDDNQKYIKAMMEKNTTEQNAEIPACVDESGSKVNVSGYGT